MKKNRTSLKEIVDISKKRAVRIVIDEEISDEDIRLLWSIARKGKGRLSDLKLDKWNTEKMKYLSKDHFLEHTDGIDRTAMREGKVFIMRNGVVTDLKDKPRDQIRDKTKKLLVREFVKPTKKIKEGDK